MAQALNETHDPTRRSWVESANEQGDFPLQNLPFCVFRPAGTEAVAIGIGIGDAILDLGRAIHAGVVPVQPALSDAASQQTLNTLMGLERNVLSQLRSTLFRLLEADCPVATRERLAGFLAPAVQCELQLPVAIGDYTDFLTSAWHTERHGRLKGLHEPLPKAFFSLPVAYHGRASSICTSGTPVCRPHGQFKSSSGSARFGPSEAMDFELELATYVGRGNPQGQPVPVNEAANHLFGFTLLNDWSAKDIQWWEQVLGPFLGKSFMTTVSPWVITAEALAPC